MVLECAVHSQEGGNGQIRAHEGIISKNLERTLRERVFEDKDKRSYSDGSVVSSGSRELNFSRKARAREGSFSRCTVFECDYEVILDLSLGKSGQSARRRQTTKFLALRRYNGADSPGNFARGRIREGVSLHHHQQHRRHYQQHRRSAPTEYIISGSLPERSLGVRTAVPAMRVRRLGIPDGYRLLSPKDKNGARCNDSLLLSRRTSILITFGRF